MSFRITIFFNALPLHIIRRFLCVVLFVLLGSFVRAQFYTGSQNTFGKNRVQYKDFYWQYYRYPLFDVYFSVGGRELAQYTAKKATTEIQSIGLQFNTIYKRRVVFIVYNTIGDFKQTNIGQSVSDQTYNVGGTTNIIDNKIILYFDGNHLTFDRQLREKIAQLFINELLFGSDSYKEILTRSATSEYPRWFTDGLASYVACEWDARTETALRDLLQQRRIKNLNHLNEQDGIVAGHALCKFIANRYGSDVLINLFYMSSITRNINQAFVYSLGSPLKSVLDSCFVWYKPRLQNSGLLIDSVSNTTKIRPRLSQGTVPVCTRISPDGSKIVYSSNEMGRYSVFLCDIAAGTRKRLIRREHRLLQVNDLAMPQFAWHPTGKLFAMSWEQAGVQRLSLYTIETGEWIDRNLPHFNKVLAINYSPDGYTLVVSAIVNGQTDLFLYDLASNTSQALTNDLADDLQPRFLNKGREVVFSSNRTSDSAINHSQEMAQNFDLWILQLNNPQARLQRLTATPYANESQAQEVAHKRYLFLSDRTGTSNHYLLAPDSTISFIDTAIHFRYFSRVAAASRWQQSVQGFDYRSGGSGPMALWFQNRSRFQFYTVSGGLTARKDTSSISPMLLQYQQKMIADSVWKQTIKDSAAARKQRWLKTVQHDSIIHINKYVFEFEKDTSLLRDSLFMPQNPNTSDLLPKVYKKAFYINKIVNQLDFGFLNESYQAFTGGEVYFSPGLNVFMKLGVIDLFEDYRLTGGVRLSSNLESNEYLVSIENMRRRLDKKLIFHRQTLEYQDNSYNYYKENQHELRGVLRWPFSPVAAMQFSGGGRYDRMTMLTTNPTNIDHPITYRWWLQSKAEYIFDNTIPRGLNLYNGWRYKFFAECYQQVWNERQTLFVVGADVRTYQRIHRNIIWANRFSYSTSGGTGNLLYYLGSVDSWYNIFSGYPTYNTDVAYDKHKNWLYQTLAVNMRGFNQNIRNGNSFALFNSELRVPIVSYLANRPIQSDALKNFQIIGFADVGAAWNGFLPSTDDNAYRYKTYNSGPVTLIVDKQRQPVVYGYGFGIRTRLFGYFVRADWATGIENNVRQTGIFYLSLSLDF